MSRRLILLTCAVLSVALSIPAIAQDWKGRGRAQGVVKDEAGEPLEGASIRLYTGLAESGPEPFPTQTNGRWGYLGLKLGFWTVEITAEGKDISTGTFQVQSQRIETLKTTLYTAEAAVVVDEAALAAKDALGRGNDLLAQGQYAEARTEFNAALEGLDPEYRGMILMEIARTYSLAGDTEGTIDALEALLQQEPENESALKLISDMLVAEGRMEEAKPYIALLPEGSTLDPDALANIGIDLFNANDFEKAIEQFDLLLDDQPDYAMGYYYRGRSHLTQLHNVEAITDFSRFLELAADSDQAGEVTEMLEYLESQE